MLSDSELIDRPLNGSITSHLRRDSLTATVGKIHPLMFMYFLCEYTVMVGSLEHDMNHLAI